MMLENHAANSLRGEEKFRFGSPGCVTDLLQA